VSSSQPSETPAQHHGGDRFSAAKGWLREHGNLQTILPIAIALGMLAYVASVASAKNSATELLQVLSQTWIPVLLLTFPYLIARALVWYGLLTQLNIRVPVRQAAVSFAGGEMTKSLPGGVYVENYLLGRLVHFGRHSLIRSSMATTAMLGLEALIAVPAALIIGVPGKRWLFWVILGVVLFWLVALGVTWIVVRYWAHGERRQEHPKIGRVAGAAEEFLRAGRELLTGETLLQCLPTALYMLVYVIDLFLILRSLGIHYVTFVDTMAVYAFVVLAVILVPIPTELGITEFTGLGVLLAYGVPQSIAAVAMLSLRVLATGLTIVVAGIVLFVLRGELSRAAEEEDDRAPRHTAEQERLQET
jgi:uncharacterized membrane protein YbhN (UPF0104 family)